MRAMRGGADRQGRQEILLRPVPGHGRQREKAEGQGRENHAGDQRPAAPQPAGAPQGKPGGEDHPSQAGTGAGRLRLPLLHPPVPHSKGQPVQLLLRLWLSAAARGEGAHRQLAVLYGQELILIAEFSKPIK